MFKSTIIASLCAGALGFAPQQTSSSSSALKATDFSKAVGVQAPLGLFGTSYDVCSISVGFLL